jgi:hypothetical protein
LKELLYLQEPSKKTILYDLFGKHSVEDVLKLLKWLVKNLDSETVLQLLTLGDKYDQSFLYYKNYKSFTDKQLSDLLLFLENEVQISKSDFKIIFLTPNNVRITLQHKISNEAVSQAFSFEAFCQKFDDTMKNGSPNVKKIELNNNQEINGTTINNSNPIDNRGSGEELENGQSSNNEHPVSTAGPRERTTAREIQGHQI